MSSLLDQRRIDAALAIADSRVSLAVERVRGLMYARSADAAPPGFVNLDTPEKVRVFTRYVSRQSEREQRGVVAGNLNQTTAANPAVQQMASESAEEVL